MKFWREIFSLSRWFLLFKLNFVPSLILKGENLQDTEKISVQKRHNTSCQNNSDRGNCMKRLCTCLVAMAISRLNKLLIKAEIKICT